MSDMIVQIKLLSHRAADVVRQILLFSRRQDTSTEAVHLDKLVREVLRLIQVSFPKNIRLIDEIPSGLPPVCADAAQMHRLILNLCTNAGQAIGAKAGEVRVALSEKTILEGQDPALRPGHYLRLTVADTGSGMDSHVMEHLFEPFFTTKAVGEGSGLGLAVVHGVVQRHGGKIEVDTKMGKGTTFIVYLPVADNPLQLSPKLIDKKIDGDGKKIVVIDDEPLIVSAVKNLLQYSGYRVDAFTDARQAIAAIAASTDKLDLVLSDLMMPGMSGIEFIEALKVIRPGLRVMVMSAYTDRLTTEMRRQLGIVKVLEKPVSLEQLRQALAEATL